MCGITGILDFNGRSATESTIRKMTDAEAHRGPDADGFFVEDGIALGHRRLSIIDLSAAANQPFVDNSGRYVMVSNGGEATLLLYGWATFSFCLRNQGHFGKRYDRSQNKQKRTD